MENGVQNPTPPSESATSLKSSLAQAEKPLWERCLGHTWFLCRERSPCGSVVSGAQRFLCLQTRQPLCLQTRHLLCQQTRHLLRQQTRHLWSPKTSPLHCPHRGGREAAAPVLPMPKGCLGRPQMSCLLTQQMSCLLTQQMSCLQRQHMSCLQTHHIVEMPQFGFARFGTPKMESGHHLHIYEDLPAKIAGMALSR